MFFANFQKEGADAKIYRNIAETYAKKTDFSFVVKDINNINFNKSEEEMNDTYDLIISRLTTLTEVNMLKHSLSTVVELYNILDDNNFD